MIWKTWIDFPKPNRRLKLLILELKYNRCIKALNHQIKLQRRNSFPSQKWGNQRWRAPTNLTNWRWILSFWSRKTSYCHRIWPSKKRQFLKLFPRIQRHLTRKQLRFLPVQLNFSSRKGLQSRKKQKFLSQKPQ